MWTPLLQPQLGLLDGQPRDLVVLGQVLAHHVVHHAPGVVLWCDGSHNFNPYDFAELNLVHGHVADHGAERVLIKRCMTPFQWDTVLTRHLAAKLDDVATSLVLVLPYDRLFSTDELREWEQVDYVRFSLAHLKGLAHEHQVSILLGIDMARWCRTHPQLAVLADEAVDQRWQVRRREDGWPEVAEVQGRLRPHRRVQATLLDFVDVATT